MNPEKVLEMVAELRALRFFPNDESVLTAIVRLCGSMCTNEQQVRWLITRMTSGIYSEWPGIAEMRGCFCHSYKPKDGISTYSTVYPDGLPPDPTAPPRIAAPDFKALPEGHHEVTVDPALEASIQQLAEKCRKPAHKFARPLAGIEIPPPDREKFAGTATVRANFTAITEADIQHALQELHARRAREAAEPVEAVEEKVVEIRERRKP